MFDKGLHFTKDIEIINMLRKELKQQGFTRYNSTSRKKWDGTKASIVYYYNNKTYEYSVIMVVRKKDRLESYYYEQDKEEYNVKRSLKHIIDWYGF